MTGPDDPSGRSVETRLKIGIDRSVRMVRKPPLKSSAEGKRSFKDTECRLSAGKLMGSLWKAAVPSGRLKVIFKVASRLASPTSDNRAAKPCVAGRERRIRSDPDDCSGIAAVDPPFVTSTTPVSGCTESTTSHPSPAGGVEESAISVQLTRVKPLAGIENGFFETKTSSPPLL